MFGLLANVAWTSLGPVGADDVETVRLRARIDGRPPRGLRRGQVPAHDRLRRAVRRTDRRRRPGAPRCLPRGRHHGHARGLRQLQRRHARHLDGRGPDLRRRRRRRRHRRWRRRLDHRHAVRRRADRGVARRTMPARRQLRHRHPARRRLRRRGRLLRHRRLEAAAAGRQGRARPRPGRRQRHAVLAQQH